MNIWGAAGGFRFGKDLRACNRDFFKEYQTKLHFIIFRSPFAFL